MKFGKLGSLTAMLLIVGMAIPETVSASCQTTTCEFECGWGWFDGSYVYRCELVCGYVCTPPGGNPDPPSPPIPSPTCGGPDAAVDTVSMYMHSGYGDTVYFPTPCRGRWGNKFELNGQVENHGSAAVEMYLRYTRNPGIYVSLPTRNTTLYSSGILSTYQSPIVPAESFRWEFRAKLSCSNLPDRNISKVGTCDLKTQYKDSRRISPSGPVRLVADIYEGDKDWCGIALNYAFTKTHSVTAHATGSFTAEFLAAQFGLSVTESIQEGHTLMIPSNIKAKIYARHEEEPHQYETYYFDWLGQPGPVVQFGTFYHQTLFPRAVPYENCNIQ